MTDAVDKVGDEQRAGNNRIQVPSFLNRYCAPDSYLDSMFAHSPLEKRLSTASIISGRMIGRCGKSVTEVIADIPDHSRRTAPMVSVIRPPIASPEFAAACLEIQAGAQDT